MDEYRLEQEFSCLCGSNLTYHLDMDALRLGFNVSGDFPNSMLRKDR